MGSISTDFPDEDGIVNVYRLHLKNDVRVYCFDGASMEWLHFVAANREKTLFPDIIEMLADTDIIGGKVANDNTARTLQLYVTGAYGIPGDSVADEYTLRMLLPNRLQDQFCFRTKKAVSCLEFLRGEWYGDGKR